MDYLAGNVQLVIAIFVVIILLNIYNKNISVMLIIHGRNTQTMLLSGVEIIRNGLLESLLLKGIN